MSTLGIIGEEIDKHAALVSDALRDLPNEGAKTSRTLTRALFDVLAPYSAALYIVERIVESDVFNADLVRAVHSRLLPIEHKADGMLEAARRQGHFDDPNIAEPLRWLEMCNEQVKDCMVALQAMLDPQLDELMEAVGKEYQRGETVPLESIL